MANRGTQVDPLPADAWSDDEVREMAASSDLSDEELTELGLLERVQQMRAAGDAPAETAPAEVPDAVAPAAESPADDGDQRPRMVPIERLNQALRSRQEERELLMERFAEMEERAAARERALLDVLNRMNGGGAPVAAPAAPPNPFQVLEERLVDLGKKLEQGEISQPDYERHRSRLEDQRISLHLQRAQPPARGANGESLSLEEHRARLEGENPWLAAVPAPTLDALSQRLGRELARMPGFGDNEASTKLLRERVVEEAKRLQFDAIFGDGTTTPNQGGGTGRPPNGSPAMGTPNAQVRDKLAVSRRQPPDYRDAPPPPAGFDVDTVEERQIIGMRVDDLAGLPDTTLDRLLRRSSLVPGRG